MNHNVLICVENGLIEDDVVFTVKEVLPAAQVHIVQDVAEAVRKLSQHRGWAWAVLDLNIEEMQNPDLRQALSDNAALPVVLRERPADPALDAWVFLDPPFSSDMLRAALRKTAPY